MHAGNMRNAQPSSLWKEVRSVTFTAPQRMPNTESRASASGLFRGLATVCQYFYYSKPGSGKNLTSAHPSRL